MMKSDSTGQKTRRKRFAVILGAGAGLVAAALPFFPWLMARAYVSPPRVTFGSLPDGFSQASIDGPGYLVPTWHDLQGEGPTVILIHGFGGSPMLWGVLAEELQDRGAALVIPAMRAHADNPAQTVGFGPGESEEIIAVAEWARIQRPGKPIVLCGVSLGGASSWLAAAKRPELFDAVATESAFAHLRWAGDEFLKADKPLFAAFSKRTTEIVSKRVGVRPEDVNPVEQAALYKGPRLVMHAEHDQLISARHAHALSEATGTPIWFIPDARHATGSVAATEEYADKILALLTDPNPLWPAP